MKIPGSTIEALIRQGRDKYGVAWQTKGFRQAAFKLFCEVEYAFSETAYQEYRSECREEGVLTDSRDAFRAELAQLAKEDFENSCPAFRPDLWRITEQKGFPELHVVKIQDSAAIDPRTLEKLCWWEFRWADFAPDTFQCFVVDRKGQGWRRINLEQARFQLLEMFSKSK